MIIALIILCLIAAILICPLNAEISYLLYKDENVLKVKIGPLKPFITVYKSGEKKQKESGKNDGGEKKKTEMTIEIIKDIISEIALLFSYFKSHLKILNLKLHFHIGADDAALTGILSGGAWGAAYDIAALIENKFNLKNKNIHVCPNFTEKVFETDISVRLSVKVFYLLIFAVKTYRAVKKLKLF